LSKTYFFTVKDVISIMISLVDTNSEKNGRMSLNIYTLSLFIKEYDKTH